jgi:hypothetical protein
MNWQHFIEPEKFFPRVYGSPTLDRILGKMNPVYSLSNYYFKIHFNIIVPFTLTCSKWSLSLRFYYDLFIGICCSDACYIPHPSHPP